MNLLLSQSSTSSQKKKKIIIKLMTFQSNPPIFVHQYIIRVKALISLKHFGRDYLSPQTNFRANSTCGSTGHMSVAKWS